MFRGKSTDPIVAIATPPGKSAIAIVRLAGNGVIQLVAPCFRGKQPLTQAKSHRLIHGWLIHPERPEPPLDEVLIAIYRAPHSYTGQDMVEIFTHGSPLLLKQILRLFTERGARLAEPGEFTLRAVLNGKMDLTRAEAIQELIEARSTRALETAIRQLRGDLFQKIRNLRQQLIELTALLELELDFADEDVEFASRPQLLHLLNQLIQEIEHLLATYRTGKALKEGIPIVIVGHPNAGKSTLFNQLIGEERAIVTDIPGTTRDYLEVEWEIHGFPVRLIDTAGLRQTTDPIEQIGIARTQQQLKQSFCALYIFDAHNQTLNQAIHNLSTLQQLQTCWILLANKVDLLTPHQKEKLRKEYQQYNLPYPLVLLSAKTGEGIPQLIETLRQKIQQEYNLEEFVLLSERHYQALSQARQSLLETQQALQQNLSTEIISSILRHALDALSILTGEITTEDILSEIFSRFCIGK